MFIGDECALRLVPTSSDIGGVEAPYAIEVINTADNPGNGLTAQNAVEIGFGHNARPAERVVVIGRIGKESLVRRLGSIWKRWGGTGWQEISSERSAHLERRTSTGILDFYVCFEDMAGRKLLAEDCFWADPWPVSSDQGPLGYPDGFACREEQEDGSNDKKSVEENKEPVGWVV